MANGDSTSPIVDRFNSLLALLRLPVQLPLLRLATPTLLLTVLEAILETRIVDVPAEWRADAEPATRLKVVQYLLRAIHQVTLGIATRTGLLPPSEAQVDKLEPRKVVDQDEHSLEPVLEVLLWIADALDIKSRPPPSPQRQRTVRVSNTSLPPPNVLKTYSKVAPEMKQGKLFSRQSPTQPRQFRAALSDTSSPSKHHRLATTHKRPPSTAASEPAPLPPQLERSASPPPLRSGPPPTTPTRRARLSTTTSFLAELARARSPAQASVSSAQTSIEGDAARSPPTSPRKSIVEVMRSIELRRTEQVCAAPGVEQRRNRSPPRGGPQDPVLLKPAESAHPFSARSRTKLRSDLASSSSPPPSPSSSSTASSATSSARDLASRPLSNRKTVRRRSRSKEADGRLPNGGASKTIDSIPPCTCTCAVSEKGSTPSRHPQKGTPSVPSTSPSSTAAATSALSFRNPRERPRSGSAASPSSSSSPAPSTPTSKRTPPPHRIRVSRISPTTLHVIPDPPSSEAGLLSVHSSTDLDLDPSSPPAPSAAPFTPPPPTQSTTISYGAGSDTPSPYTLLLLAHRDRLREKLRILERRERDREAAAAVMAGAERQTMVPLPGEGPGTMEGVAV
ncbi:hypothetical protein B0A53_06352 [Rhodotorula sp. CCFEE 5036]|nr:hypothetical protein B0A53_06352 [Rhodotorula sp. CCFEE 5036]